MKVAAVIAGAALLGGCSLVPDKPTAYARKACFKGHIQADAGVVSASGTAAGEYRAVSVQTFGAISDLAVETIAAADCPNGDL